MCHLPSCLRSRDEGRNSQLHGRGLFSPDRISCRGETPCSHCDEFAFFDKIRTLVLPNGLLFINSSLIEPKETYRKDIEIFSIPVNEIAIDHGNPKLANMVALGAFNQKTKLVQMTSLFESLEKVLDERYHHLVPSNIKASKLEPNLLEITYPSLSLKGLAPQVRSEEWKGP